MEFIFIRHGQTDWNKKRLTLGHIDQELDEEGIKQSYELVPKLEKFEFDVVFTSPLKRARQTAEIIANHFKIPIVNNDNLKERDFGSLVGKTWEQNSAMAGIDLKAIDRKLQYDYSPYGGESADQVKTRVLTFIREAKGSGYKKPLVVSHSGIIRMLHHLYYDEIDTISNNSIHYFNIP